MGRIDCIFMYIHICIHPQRVAKGCYVLCLDLPNWWNAVYINKKWFFVDATWGMGGDYMAFENVRTVAEHRKEVRKKKRQKNREINASRFVENKWFLVKPEDMIKTHFPRREKHQYLKHPVDMKKIFRENARKKERNK